MKKLFLFFAMLGSLMAGAQAPVDQTRDPRIFRNWGSQARFALIIPGGSTPSFPFNVPDSLKKRAIYMDTLGSDAGLKRWNGSAFVNAVTAPDLSGYATKGGTDTITGAKIFTQNLTVSGGNNGLGIYTANGGFYNSTVSTVLQAYQRNGLRILGPSGANVADFNDGGMTADNPNITFYRDIRFSNAPPDIFGTSSVLLRDNTFGTLVKRPLTDFAFASDTSYLARKAGSANLVQNSYTGKYVQTLAPQFPYLLYKSFGDSITYGVGASSTANAWAYIFAAYIGLPGFTDPAVPGDQAADQQTFIYPQVVTNNGNELYSLSIGSNDVTQYVADANKQANFKAIHQADAAYLAIPDVNKIKGTSGSVSYSGSWTNSTLNTIGRYSSTNGNTATFTVNGTVVYVAYSLVDGNLGTGTVTIDGGTPININGYGAGGTAIATINGRTNGSALLRVPGLSAGNHTVIITVTSATGSGNKLYFDWAAGNGNLYPVAGKPLVLVANIPLRFTQVDLPTFNGLIATNNSQLKGDGLNIESVNIQNALNQNTMLAADMSHPNDAGHPVLQRRYKLVIDSLNNYTGYGNASTVGDIVSKGDIKVSVIQPYVANTGISIVNNRTFTNPGTALGLGYATFTNTTGTASLLASNMTVAASGTAGDIGWYFNKDIKSQGSSSIHELLRMAVGGVSRYVIDDAGSAFTNGGYKSLVGANDNSYNTIDIITNYERFVRNFSGSGSTGQYNMRTSAGGTGTIPKLNIGTANRNMTFTEIAALTGFYNITTATGAATTIFGISPTLQAAGGTSNVLALLPTINQSGSNTGYRGQWISVYEQAIVSGPHLLFDYGTNTAANGGGTHSSKVTGDNTGLLKSIHLGGLSGAPTIAAGTGAGTSPTVSISGNDVAATVTITTGTSPTVSAVVATVTFNTDFGAAPKLVLIPVNGPATELAATSRVFADESSTTTTTATLKVGAGGLAASTTYKFTLIAIQ